MKKQIKGFAIGFTVCLLLANSTSLASGFKRTIEVLVNSINLTVNGQRVEVDNFVYNQTTYIPLRAVAELLGKEVGWHQSTQTVSIDDKKNSLNNFKEDEGYVSLDEYLLAVKVDGETYFIDTSAHIITNRNDNNLYIPFNQINLLLSVAYGDYEVVEVGLSSNKYVSNTKDFVEYKSIDISQDGSVYIDGSFSNNDKTERYYWSTHKDKENNCIVVNNIPYISVTNVFKQFGIEHNIQTGDIKYKYIIFSFDN